MSPEQVQGLPVDLRSDLYSFATVAYEALTGQRTVPSEALGQALFEVLHKKPAPITSILHGASLALERMFARALEKDPEARATDIESWSSACAELVEGLPGAGQGWDLSRATSSNDGPVPESANTRVQR
jgi:serine/threonine protein kinase